MKKAALTPSAIDRTIRQNLAKLRKPGVLTVRPGFEIANHQLTGRRAIVATVHTKTRDLPAGQLLPRAINRVPVDVRQATPHQRLRANDPAAAALTQTFGRPQDKEPTWPLEREMPSGQLLSSPKSKTQQALTGFAARQPVVAKALAAHAAKPKITYVPAPGEPLNPVQTTTTIIAHVSPDAGFTTLTSFIQGTKKSLVIGMYDFTSGPILALFKTVLTKPKTLQMVLDNPPPNATRNQLDSQTVQELDAALGSRSRIVRALAGDDSLVSAQMFPTSYHIKVMVRDSAALWLSSGNLNNSNQPDTASPPKTEDRDWSRDHRRSDAGEFVRGVSESGLQIRATLPNCRKPCVDRGGSRCRREACRGNKFAAGAIRPDVDRNRGRKDIRQYQRQCYAAADAGHVAAGNRGSIRH